MTIDTNTKFLWWMNSVAISDLVGQLRCTVEYAQDKYFNELEKRLHLNDLYTAAIAEGWETFDWDRGHEEGWFCHNDYLIMPELEKYKDEKIRTWTGN